MAWTSRYFLLGVIQQLQGFFHEQISQPLGEENKVVFARRLIP
jgi:hypothetical protein